MIGTISAIGAAISWTWACFIWRNQTTKYDPIDINFFKNLFAFCVYTPALFSLNFDIEFKYFCILLFSGLVGIGLGDTFYLKSLKLIGTRKTLSIESLSPLIASLFGDFFINENLSLKSWIGILLVSLSMINIIGKESNLYNNDSILVPSKFKPKNYIYGLISIFCAVFAATLSRYVLVNSELSPIETTEIRLIGSIIFLIPLTKLNIRLFVGEMERKERSNFFISIFLGTNLGILLQQIVFKELPIGIGWTLLSTTPIFSIIFARKEEGLISREIIIFSFLLVIGISLIIL